MGVCDWVRQVKILWYYPKYEERSWKMGKWGKETSLLPKIQGKKSIIGQGRREWFVITQNPGKEANNWARQKRMVCYYPKSKKRS